MPTTYALDTFTRSVTDGWSASGNEPEVGGLYTLTGAAADFDVGSGVGTQNVPSAGATRAAKLPDVSAQDVDVEVTVSTDKIAVGAPITTRLYLRDQGALGTNTYRVALSFEASGAVRLTWSKIIDGGTPVAIGSTITVSGLTHAAGTAFKVRAQIEGTALRAKAWLASGAEPETWDNEPAGGDSEATLQAAGAVGIQTTTGAAFTNGAVLLTFDNFRVQSVAQLLYLASTFDRGAWTAFPGEGTTNIHLEVNETIRDDSDGIQSSPSPVSADIYKGNFDASGNLPNTGAGVLRYPIQKDVPGGETINAIVRLMQGATEIASWTHEDVPNGWTLFERALSSAEVDQITDLSTLRIHIEAVKP